MNLPTSGGHSALRSIVSIKAETYTVTRRSHESGAMGGTMEESTHEADMWVGSPNEVVQDTEYGDRLTGNLSGLAMPDTDVEQGDRITYQGAPYEVQETITSDSDAGDTLLAINFERVNNE